MLGQTSDFWEIDVCVYKKFKMIKSIFTQSYGDGRFGNVPLSLQIRISVAVSQPEAQQQIPEPSRTVMYSKGCLIMRPRRLQGNNQLALTDELINTRG